MEQRAPPRRRKEGAMLAPLLATAEASSSGQLVPGITEHNLLLTLLQLALLLGLARGLGFLASRFGMPAVLGELTAGIVLGPSLLGSVWPDGFAALFPPEALQRNLLDLVAFLGVVLLLILTGLEIDTKLIAAKGRSAAMISVGGMAVPFAFGYLTATYLVPDRFMGADTPTLTFALFIGTALAISAIPVIAKVLIELGVIKRDIGQLTLAAAMIDDATAWILLSVVAGMATTGVADLGQAGVSVLTVLGVLALTFTVFRAAAGRLFRWVDNTLPGESPKITLVLVLAFGWAAFTLELGIEAVLGAFMVGIVFGTFKRFDHHLVHILETVTLGVFAPIFFARAGLVVDLPALFTADVLPVAGLMLVVAIAGKFLGCYAGAKAARLGRYEALAVGAGMNARGAVEIIVATIGFNLGVISIEMFTIIVMIAVVTSLMAPPLLRFLLVRIPLTDEERLRLEGEARRRTSFLGNVHRLLLPTRGGSNSQVAAQLVSYIVDKEEIEVTAMYIEPVSAAAVAPALAGAAGATAAPAQASGSSEVEARMSRLEHQLRSVPRLQLRRIVRSARPTIADAVLAEASKGYDLVVLGATETRSRDGSAETTFSTMVDPVVQGSPVPVLVVSARMADDPDTPIDPIPLHRILLPTTGQDADRLAAEVAFAIAEERDMVVDVVHFVERGDDIAILVNETLDHTREIAEGVVAKTGALGMTLGASVHTEVVETSLPVEAAIVERAVATGADLIVLRSEERAVTRRAFLGHGTDHILRNAPCPVAVVTEA
jgi:Kef-type K+ transport system membrane component KefB/nucleotide-binding universal stress UspA family protein